MLSEIPIAVAGTGGGTTMEAVHNATKDGSLKGRIKVVAVFASREDAGLMPRMREAGIAGRDILLYPKGYSKDPDMLAEFILRECAARGALMWCQYGLLPLTPVPVVEHFRGHSVNQHPGSLDPAAPEGYDFGGKHMHGRRVMLAAILFSRFVGRYLVAEAVAHRVGTRLDRAEVLGIRRVCLYPSMEVDGSGGLKERMLAAEHQLQVEVLERFHSGTLKPLSRPAHWLVKPGERAILEYCKALAVSVYPDG